MKTVSFAAAIVTANYLNRESDYKWLVRDANTKPEDATPCKVVTFKEGQVERAYEEEGFGCSVRVTAKDVVAHGPEPKEVEVTSQVFFNGIKFVYLRHETLNGAEAGKKMKELTDATRNAQTEKEWDKNRKALNAFQQEVTSHTITEWRDAKLGEDGSITATFTIVE